MDPMQRGSELVDRLADEPLAERLSGAVQPLAERVAPEGPRRRFLQGEWLGHALHPAVTDLPIGFWTGSMVLDLFGGRRARRISRRFIAMGVASAIPAAATGLAEWTRTDTRTGRIAAVHGTANVAATSLYLLSWGARRRGRHWRGVALGLLGGLVATGSAYLGGHLAFARGVGVGDRGTGVGTEGQATGTWGDDRTAGVPVEDWSTGAGAESLTAPVVVDDRTSVT